MRQIALVYPKANLDTVPCLVGTIELLARAGYAVDVFTQVRAAEPPPAFTSECVRLRSLGVEDLAQQSTAALRGAVRQARWVPAVVRRPLRRGYAALDAGLSRGARLLARHQALATSSRYDLVIGVDPDGLVLAQRLARGAPLAYFSLELLLSAELTRPSEHQLKAQERALSQQAAFVIIQDEARARLLAEDNHLPDDKLVLVPNAPLGPARRQSSRYWHARFGLGANRRVALHAGSLGDWTGIGQVVASVADWPSDWVLVVHTRYDAESSAYVQALRQHADPERVLFSLKAVPREAYPALVDGADVGIAFYVPTDESAWTQRNIATIGLSSGKLAHYLQAGVPVIVNQAASIADLIDRSRCGVAVPNGRAIGDALRGIAADYARYSRAACAFFADHLEFERAFVRVLERIGALV